MDSIDYEIIKLMQENGRISIKNLAKAVSLTPPATAERIKKLEESGIIKGFRAIVDPSKLGKAIKAIINVTLKTEKRKEFFDLVANEESITECHRVTGLYSMTLKVIVREMSDLEILVGKIQQYGNTETLIILSSPVEYKTIT